MNASRYALSVRLGSGAEFTVTIGGGSDEVVEVAVGKTATLPGPQAVKKKNTAIKFNQRRSFIMNLSVSGV